MNITAIILSICLLTAPYAPEQIEENTTGVAIEQETIRPEIVPLGIFKIYHYCSCNKCGGSKTATGTTAQVDHTIAVDPKVIPLGAKIKIGETWYTAEDTGGSIKGNKVDIFVGSHSEAIKKGTYHAEIYTQN